MHVPKSEDGSTAASASPQLKSARKLIWSKHFLVKEHLKPSFIDGAADLNHIRVRRGRMSRSGKRFLGRGKTGRPLELSSYSRQGEHYDQPNHLQRDPTQPASCRMGIRASDFTCRSAGLWPASPPAVLQQFRLGRREPE